MLCRGWRRALVPGCVASFTRAGAAGPSAGERERPAAPRRKVPEASTTRCRAPVTWVLALSFLLLLACCYGAAGCARGPGCNELLERYAHAFNECGIDATAAWEDFECTERERAALECEVSCLEAASCDAFGGMDAVANGKYVACLDYCLTFIDLPDDESEW